MKEGEVEGMREGGGEVEWKVGMREGGMGWEVMGRGKWEVMIWVEGMEGVGYVG